MVYIGIFNEYAVLWNTETYILSCHRRGKSHYFFLTTAFHPSLIFLIFLIISFFPFTPLSLPSIHRYH